MSIKNLQPQLVQSKANRMIGAIDRLALATKEVGADVTANKTEFFTQAGEQGSAILVLSALAKDAVNTLIFGLGLAPSEADRIMAIAQDLLTSQPIDNTITDATEKEELLAKAVGLAYQVGALEGATMTIPAAFSVELQGGGVVVASDFVEE